MYLYIKVMTLVKKIMLTGLIGFFSLNVCAEVETAQIQALATQSYRQSKTMLPQVLQSLHQENVPIPVKNTKEPLLFVSLGMPDSLLKQLLMEANREKVSVVIRGFYQDSFDATLKRLFELMPKDKMEKHFDGLLINPLWFKQYHITTVPAVVMPYAHDDYDVIFGNITLNDALAMIRQHRQGERA